MRALAAVALAAAGAVTGLAAVVLHERWWGLPLAAAATVPTLAALAPGWSSRLAFAAGWAGMVLVLASPRPEGDYAVSRDLPGYALLGLGSVVLLTGLLTLPGPAGRGRRGGAGGAGPAGGRQRGLARSLRADDGVRAEASSRAWSLHTETAIPTRGTPASQRRTPHADPSLVDAELGRPVAC